MFSQNFSKELLYLIDKPAFLLNSKNELVECNNAFKATISKYGKKISPYLALKDLADCKSLKFLHLDNALKLLKYLSDNTSFSNQDWLATKFFESEDNLFYLFVTKHVEDRTIDEETKEIYAMYVSIFGEEPDKDLTTVDLLKEIKHHYEYIFTNIPHSVYWKDLNGIYRGASQGLADLVGLEKPSDVIGLDDNDLEKLVGWPSGTAESFRRDDFNVIESGKPLLNREEEVFNRADGTDIYQITNKIPVRNSKNSIKGVFGVATDITAVKKSNFLNKELKDALFDANEEKKKFMFIVSTRVRSNLSGIEMSSQILQDPNSTPEQRKDAIELQEKVVSKTLRLFDHTMDYLNLSSYPPPAPFNLKESMELVVHGNRRLMSQKKIIAIVNYDSDIPDQVKGENRKLQRVIETLLVNAFTYSECGLVEIYIQKKELTNTQIKVNIIVKDNGVGISKEKLEGLFDIFEKTTLDRPYQTCGFILSLTKRWVENLGGTISVKSEEGKGTQFTVSLPFELTSDRDSLSTPSLLKEAISPVLFARNNWFLEIIQKFIPVQKPKLITVEEKLKDFSSVMQKHAIAIIDGYSDFEDIRQFINSFQLNRENMPLFVAIISDNIEEDKYNGLFNSNTVAIKVDLPLTPGQFNYQFISNYQRWLNGHWAYIKDAISQHAIRVYYVEDGEIASRSLAIGFTAANCTYLCTNSGENAIKAVGNDSTQRFDIFFLDLGLPGISGFDLVMYLRKHPIYAKVPIIAETAFITEADTIRCFEAGFTDVITKPVMLKDIQRMLDRYVRNPKEEDLE